MDSYSPSSSVDLIRPANIPIIVGERRWRAIAQSPILDRVVAMLRSDDLDEATIVLLQIAENTQREGITAMEQAPRDHSLRHPLQTAGPDTTRRRRKPST